LLACTCGNLFPVIDRVPRFIENNLNKYPHFIRKFGKKIAELLRNEGILSRNLKMDDYFVSIQESFTEEWRFFDYEIDNTWGWDVNDRKKVFLSEIGEEPASLSGKLLFDAGCGNGILSTVLNEFGLEVVGMDISESVLRAEANKRKFTKGNYHFVHFIQGNLFNPPFREKIFDLVYSSGVLHHCPDTRETFLKLTPLVKRGGRLYIWVYGKRGVIPRFFAWHGRALRKRISLKGLFNYCSILAPVYKVASDLLSALKIYKFRKRTIREITLDLFDIFSPQFNHSHLPEEVLAWFEREGFTKISMAGESKHGFGVRGNIK
jgi:SAM-dependent methyltransferase